MAKTCFVCKSLHVEMISIFQHPKKLNFILKHLLGIEAKQNDYLCIGCCGELINAFESKQMIDQSNQKRLETPWYSGTVFKEETNFDGKIETMISEISVVTIMQESEGDLVTNFDKMNAGTKTTELSEQLETGDSEAPKNNIISKKTTRPHVNKTSYVCNDCGKNFTSAWNLNIHRKFHSEEKPHVCQYCSRSFTLKGGLKRHLRIHTQKKPFECTICGKKFTFTRDFESHKRIHTGEKPYACNYCPKTFTCSSGLRAHVLIHMNEKSYVCADCGKGFNKASDLWVHRKFHSGEKPHVCQYCSQAFTLKGGLKRHLRTHTKEKPFRCTMCGKNFSTSASLKVHKRIHTGEKPYACNYCPKVFTYSKTLRAHLFVHKNEKSQVCSDCGKSFNSAPNLKSYRMTDNREKPFACCDCFKTFRSDRDFRKHKCIHSKDERFRCSECKETFSSSSLLQTQKSVHTEETPFTCLYCPKTYKTCSDRLRHVRNMHPKKINDFGCEEKHQSSDEAVEKTEADLVDQTEIVISKSESALEIKSESNEYLQRNCDVFSETTEAKVILNNSEMRYIPKRLETSWDNGAVFKEETNNDGQIETMIPEMPVVTIKQESEGELVTNFDKMISTFDETTSECKETFSSSSLLETQKSIHTEETPFTCLYCPKTYKTCSGRLRHVRNMHPKEINDLGCKEKRQSNDEAIEINETDLLDQPEIVISTSEPALEIKSESNGYSERHFDTFSGTTEAKVMLNNSELNILETSWDNGAVFKEETNADGQVEAMTTEMPVVSIKQESEGELVTNFDKMNAGTKTTELSEQLETGDSEAPKNNIISKKTTRAHSNKRTYVCNDCGKNFTSAGNLNIHRKFHSGEKPHVCQYCSQAFTLKGGLKRHLRTHTKEKPFGCTICEKKFTLMRDFESHKRIHTEVKPYACNYCPKTFTYSSGLRAHVLIHMNEKSYVCVDCGKGFNKSSDLWVHRKFHSGEKPHVCQYCSQAFTLKGGLKRHLRTHTKEKPFGCTMCGKNFSTSGSLKVHKRIHTGEKPYACNYCPKAFTCSKSLRAHLFVHKNEKSQVCSDCGKSFNSALNLKSYRMTDNREKPFACCDCSKTFRSDRDFRKHKCIHSKDERFRCSECKETFSSSSLLQTQKSVHPEETPFTCLYCPKTYKTCSDRLRHVRNMHPKEINDFGCKEKHQSTDEAIEKNETDLVDLAEIVISKSQLALEIKSESKEYSEKDFGVFSETTEVKVMLNNSELNILETPWGNGAVFKEETNADGQVEAMTTEMPVVTIKQESEGELMTNFDKMISTFDETISECKETFSSSSLLETEKSVHTEETPFTCLYCPKAFKTCFGRLRHVRNTHPKEINDLGCKEKRQSNDEAIEKNETDLVDQTEIVISTSEPALEIKSESNEYSERHFDTFSETTEAKVMLNNSELNILETSWDNGAVFKEETNVDGQIEAMTPEMPVITIKQESEDEVGTNFHKMNAGTKTTELSEQLETGGSAPPRNNEISNKNTRVHANKTSYVCNDCGKNFTSASNLNTHRKIHSGKKPHVCHYCSRAFTLKSGLKQHLLIHTKEKPFECTMCGKKFTSSQRLKCHKRIHTGEKPYACTYCPKTFTFSRNLRVHVLVHKNERSYGCSECGKGFKSAKELKVHRKFHSGEKPHVCPYCSRAFTLKGDLKRHLRIHTKEKPFECTMCGKNFPTSASLKVHKRIHTGEKPYACSDCGKSFTNGPNLKMHKKIHSREKPHICPYCSRAFTLKSGLRKHLCIHTKTKSFECTMCGKNLTTSVGLRVHMRIHTGEKPYACNYCPKTFTCSSGLRVHVLVHKNERSYVCSDCGKGFNSPMNLKSHRSVHTGEKTFICLYCPKAFKTRSGRIRHVRSMHPKEINDFGCREKHQSSDEAVEIKETNLADQNEIVTSKRDSKLGIKSESNDYSEWNFDVFNETTQAKVMLNNSKMRQSTDE